MKVKVRFYEISEDFIDIDENAIDELWNEDKFNSFLEYCSNEIYKKGHEISNYDDGIISISTVDGEPIIEP